MGSPTAPRVTRRRQRSTRVSVAVGLVALAALAVAGAASTGSWLLTTLAGGLAVLLGGTAARIVHTELVESRVLAARDRAEQAHAFNLLNEQRVGEHEHRVAELRALLAERTSAHARAQEQLETALASSQRRAATATRRHHAEARRATGLQARLTDAERRAEVSGLRVSELEHEISYLRAELDSTTVAWRSSQQEGRRRALGG